MARVRDFYEGTNVLITGGTGFLGVALIEKLLRSCEVTKGIYLLVRPMRGVSPEDRVDKLLSDKIFSNIRKTEPEKLKKVKVVYGDICETNLNLNNEDKAMLIDIINIVFHLAANVRFDNDLKTAFKTNAVGTYNLLEMCKDMRKLKIFIYVSTAYSNADKETIEEVVYEPLYDPKTLIGQIETMTQAEVDRMENIMLKIHPNTYTATKAMAENIVSDYSKKVPSAIVRPSVISGSWKEPYPGWLQGFSSAIVIPFGFANGMLNSLLGNEMVITDVIPVDIVVNTIITAAWQSAKEKSDTINVYNCTSGSRAPITLKTWNETLLKYSRAYPTKYLQWYPTVTVRKNTKLHAFHAFIQHTLPSIVLDLHLYCNKQKPVALKICKKINQAVDTAAFALMHQKNFGCSRIISLSETLTRTGENKDFFIDIADLDWDAYCKYCMIEIRTSILKDDLESLPEAKKKLKRLYVIHVMTRAIGIIIVIYLFGIMIKKTYQTYVGM